MTNTEEAPTKEGLLEYQLKYCGQVLLKLKKNGNAPPFLEPVDPVKLGIPDYPLKISHPMDLSTIKKNLDNKSYATPADFDSDVKLMFNNCYTYNPEGTVVYNMGKALEAVYNDLMSSMPNEIVKRKTKMDLPVTERSKQPKRNIKPVDSMSIVDHEFCIDVLSDLTKHKNKSWNWPFLEPVDATLVPDYFTVIKNPMDLHTMRNKLDQRKYNSVDEFINDLRLIVDNCYKFNPPGTEVYICGQELEKSINNHVQKVAPVDLKEKILDIKRKIVSLSKELKVLETKLAEQNGEFAPATRAYNISERLSIGNDILKMSRAQTEQVARIIQKHSAGEYVENDEIEIDLRMIPDALVEEIDLYIKKINAGIDDIPPEKNIVL